MTKANLPKLHTCRSVLHVVFQREPLSYACVQMDLQAPTGFR